MTRLSNATLLVLAAVGFAIPNAFFIPWLVSVWPDVTAMLRDRAATALLLDATIAMIWIAAWMARDTAARVRWPWFIVLSFLGGLGFAIPLWLWLNRRRRAA